MVDTTRDYRQHAFGHCGGTCDTILGISPTSTLHTPHPCAGVRWAAFSTTHQPTGIVPDEPSLLEYISSFPSIPPSLVFLSLSLTHSPPPLSAPLCSSLYNECLRLNIISTLLPVLYNSRRIFEKHTHTSKRASSCCRIILSDASSTFTERRISLTATSSSESLGMLPAMVLANVKEQGSGGGRGPISRGTTIDSRPYAYFGMDLHTKPPPRSRNTTDKPQHQQHKRANSTRGSTRLEWEHGFAAVADRENRPVGLARG